MHNTGPSASGPAFLLPVQGPGVLGPCTVQRKVDVIYIYIYIYIYMCIHICIHMYTSLYTTIFQSMIQS